MIDDLRFYAATWLGTMVLMAVALAAAVCLPGCAPGADGLRQGISATSRIVASGYRAASIYDTTRQTQIRTKATTDARGAQADLNAYLPKYDVAKKALDDAADLIDPAVKIADLYEAGAASSKDAAAWIAKLSAAALAVTTALHDMGVF